MKLINAVFALLTLILIFNFAYHRQNEKNNQNFPHVPEVGARGSTRDSGEDANVNLSPNKKFTFWPDASLECEIDKYAHAVTCWHIGEKGEP